MSDAKILVVEDDPTLGIALTDALRQSGHRVTLETDGARALAKATKERYDLVLLDLMLPTMDGFTVCRRLREAGVRTPILMLTARGREEDRVKGLDLGADDYLVKPFSMKELEARVRARLRGAEAVVPATVALGGAVVDLDALVVRRGDAATALTKTEADLLRVFLKNPGKVLSRNRFLDEVWGFDRYPTTRTVDMHVARLREKLGGDDADRPLIATVHGLGYRLDVPEPPRESRAS